MSFYKTLLDHLKVHIKEVFDKEFTNDHFGAEHQILEKYKKSFKYKIPTLNKDFVVSKVCDAYKTIDKDISI